MSQQREFGRRTPDFPTAVTVSTTDLLLLWQDGTQKNAPVGLIQTALVPPSYLASLSDVSLTNPLNSGEILTWSGTQWTNTSIALPDLVSIQNQFASVHTEIVALSAQTSNLTSITTDLSDRITSVDSRATSINNVVSNGLSVVSSRITSVDQRVTSVYNDVPRNLVSLADTSLPTGPDTDNQVVTWDDNQGKFILTSVAGITGIAILSAAITSVDNRVTALSADLTSVNSRIDTVSNAVSGRVLRTGDTMTGSLFMTSGSIVIGTVASPGAAQITIGGGGSNLGTLQIGFNSTAANNWVIGNNTSQQLLLSYGNAGSQSTRLVIDGSVGGALRPIGLGMSAAPVYSTNTDTDTGFIFVSNNQIGVITGSVESVRFSNSVATFKVPVLLSADPTTSLQAATKQYVDNTVSNATSALTSVIGTYPKNLVSLLDVSAATVSAGANGYALTYNSGDGKFRLTSVGGGGGGDVASVDARVTSVNTRVDGVSANVTSVYNLVSNLTSVVAVNSASMTALSANITSVYNFTSNGLSVAAAGRTSLSNRIDTVSANTTSVYNFASNQSSVLGARITSVQVCVPRNLVSLSDTSLATGAGTNGYAVTWSNAQARFILSSVGGGPGGSNTIPVIVTGGSTSIASAPAYVIASLVAEVTLQLPAPSDGKYLYVTNNQESSNVLVLDDPASPYITDANTNQTIDYIESGENYALFSDGSGWWGLNVSDKKLKSINSEDVSVISLTNTPAYVYGDGIVASVVELPDVPKPGTFHYIVNGPLSDKSVSISSDFADVFDFLTGSVVTSVPVGSGYLFIAADTGNWHAFPLATEGVSQSDFETAVLILLANIASVDARVNTVSANVTSVKNFASNGLSVQDARSTSLRTDITSVYNFASNGLSVQGARTTSVQAGLTSVDARVTSLRTDITSVYNFASNGLSVAQAGRTSLSNRIDTVSADVTSIKGQLTTGLNKAWVNFNGSAQNSIRGSFNVAGVSRTNAGRYTITFTNQFTSVGYCAYGYCGDTTGNGTQVRAFTAVSGATLTVSTFSTMAITGATGPQDVSVGMLAFTGI